FDRGCGASPRGKQRAINAVAGKKFREWREIQIEISGGHYANGNHIHGGGGRNGVFAGGGVAGGRADLRTSVPSVFCFGQAVAADGCPEVGRNRRGEELNLLRAGYALRLGGSFRLRGTRLLRQL